MVRKRVSTLVLFGFAATVAVAAHAGGPARGGAVVVTGGGGILGRPAIGVFPTAPAAIAPSFRNSTFARTRFFGPPLVVGAGVPLLVGPPAYYDPSAVALPPVAYVAPAPAATPPAPPPPPEREVVEHSDGRYELRGDGIAVPYRWAWIPKAPPPPAFRPKPDVRLYAWTDEQGVLHVTDRLDRIPERHRAEAQRNASS